MNVEVTTPVPTTPTYLTVGEMATELRVAKMTIYRLLAAGEIAYVEIGRQFRVERADFDAYLEQQRHAARR